MATKKNPGEKKQGEAPNELSFEEALVQLDAIVQALERGELSLEDSLTRYEEGIGHLARCTRFLNEAEHKIELLTGISEANAAQTQSFDEGSTTLEQKAAARGKRRSAGAMTPKGDSDRDDGAPPIGSLF